jgi:hypothetical protein
MVEKERLNQETDKIKKNKFLKMVDRGNAIKSVRSLSKTIDDLINKEKGKIEDHYNSKILEKSNVEENKAYEEPLKNSTFKNTLNYNIKPSPGGTTDSLAFS